MSRDMFNENNQRYKILLESITIDKLRHKDNTTFWKLSFSNKKEEDSTMQWSHIELLDSKEMLMKGFWLY